MQFRPIRWLDFLSEVYNNNYNINDDDDDEYDNDNNNIAPFPEDTRRCLLVLGKKIIWSIQYTKKKNMNEEEIGKKIPYYTGYLLYYELVNGIIVFVTGSNEYQEVKGMLNIFQVFGITNYRDHPDLQSGH